MSLHIRNEKLPSLIKFLIFRKIQMYNAPGRWMFSVLGMTSKEIHNISLLTYSLK